MALPAGVSLDAFHASKLEESRKRKRPPSEWHRSMPSRGSSNDEAAGSALDGMDLELRAGRNCGIMRETHTVLAKKAHSALKASCPLQDLHAIVHRRVVEGRDYRRFRVLLQLAAPLDADHDTPDFKSSSGGRSAQPEVVSAVAVQVHTIEVAGVRDPTPCAIEVAAFCTARGHRRRGHGRRLVDQIRVIARRLELRAIYVAVAPTKRDFWERVGFRSLKCFSENQQARFMREQRFISTPGTIMLKFELPELQAAKGVQQLQLAGWRTVGHRFLGQRLLLRRPLQQGDIAATAAAAARSMAGTVVGWLSAQESSLGKPVWHVALDDGEELDLEQRAVQRAIDANADAAGKQQGHVRSRTRAKNTSARQRRVERSGAVDDAPKQGAGADGDSGDAAQSPLPRGADAGGRCAASLTPPSQSRPSSRTAERVDSGHAADCSTIKLATPGQRQEQEQERAAATAAPEALQSLCSSSKVSQQANSSHPRPTLVPPDSEHSGSMSAGDRMDEVAKAGPDWRAPSAARDQGNAYGPFVGSRLRWYVAVQGVVVAYHPKLSAASASHKSGGEASAVPAAWVVVRDDGVEEILDANDMEAGMQLYSERVEPDESVEKHEKMLEQHAPKNARGRGRGKGGIRLAAGRGRSRGRGGSSGLGRGRGTDTLLARDFTPQFDPLGGPSLGGFSMDSMEADAEAWQHTDPESDTVSAANDDAVAIMPPIPADPDALGDMPSDMQMCPAPPPQQRFLSTTRGHTCIFLGRRVVWPPKPLDVPADSGPDFDAIAQSGFDTPVSPSKPLSTVPCDGLSPPRGHTHASPPLSLPAESVMTTITATAPATTAAVGDVTTATVSAPVVDFTSAAAEIEAPNDDVVLSASPLSRPLSMSHALSPLKQPLLYSAAGCEGGDHDGGDISFRSSRTADDGNGDAAAKAKFGTVVGYAPGTALINGSCQGALWRIQFDGEALPTQHAFATATLPQLLRALACNNGADKSRATVLRERREQLLRVLRGDGAAAPSLTPLALTSMANEELPLSQCSAHWRTKPSASDNSGEGNVIVVGTAGDEKRPSPGACIGKCVRRLVPVFATVTHHLPAKSIGGGRYFPPLWHLCRDDGDEADLEQANVELLRVKMPLPRARQLQLLQEDGWRTSGHPFIGQRVRRQFECHVAAEGVILGWLSEEDNEGTALWHVCHDDGDEEDLDADEAREAVRFERERRAFEQAFVGCVTLAPPPDGGIAPVDISQPAASVALQRKPSTARPLQRNWSQGESQRGAGRRTERQQELDEERRVLTADARDTMECAEFDIMFETGRLGINLSYNNSVDPSFAFVVAIEAGTQAQYCPIKKGDKLTRINGVSCVGKSFEAIIGEIVNAHGRRRLGFQRILIGVSGAGHDGDMVPVVLEGGNQRITKRGRGRSNKVTPKVAGSPATESKLQLESQKKQHRDTLAGMDTVTGIENSAQRASTLSL